MTYLTEFPDFANEPGAAEAAAFLLANGFEDTSWANDACPAFTCDVFVLRMDYADTAKREAECEGLGRFTIECEGEVYLETDSWADVVAFIDDGKRDFAPYVRKVA